MTYLIMLTWIDFIKPIDPVGTDLQYGILSYRFLTLLI